MNKKHLQILIICMVISMWSCGDFQKKRTIILEEKAGITRDLEYVKISFPDDHENNIFLKEVTSGDIIRGEKLNFENYTKDSSSYIFPISIKANEKKSFQVTNSRVEIELLKMEVSGKNASLSVENESFIADFNSMSKGEEDGLFSGQLSGIYIKSKEILLKRGHINMHWAPNFQKEGLGYKTIAHANSSGTKVTQNNSYLFEMIKSGAVNNYEEIDLKGQYNFYAGLPYFLYSSTMSFNKDVELYLLRNDEMTMDSLFTHLIYPNSLSRIKNLALYDMVKIDSLTKSPLADDISWVGFINKLHGYGFVSLRLTYDNRNMNGTKSVLYQPHTKISVSSGGGRYWNRRLIHNHNVLVPKGSMYYEQNAYLVLDDLDGIEDQINYYLNCLNNPIEVSYLVK